MKEYWFTSQGQECPAKSPMRRLLVQEVSPYEYILQERVKGNNLKNRGKGPIEWITNAFERFTGGAELKLGPTFYDAKQRVCFDTEAVWKRDGESLFVRTSNGWLLHKGSMDLDIFYYDDDCVACAEEDAVSIYAILPGGTRVRLNNKHTFIEYVETPFQGRRTFLTKELKICKAPEASYRLLYNEKTDKVSVFSKNALNWVLLGDIPGFSIDTEIPRIGIKQDGVQYFDADMSPTEQDSATYTAITKIPGFLVKLYKDEELVCVGTPAEIAAYKPEVIIPPAPEPEPEPEPVQVTEPKPQINRYAIEDKVWNLVSASTYIPREYLGDYLYICMWRNRISKNGAVFNSRLTDILGQPIYLVDTSYNSEGITENTKLHTSNLRVVSTLEEARKYAPGLQYLPAPLQWASSPSRYLWDPAIPLMPITPNVIQHVCVERKDRLPEELRNMQPAVLMQAIKQSIEDGARQASTDIFHALPSYSREHNEVSMMLPIRLPLLYGDSVVAVALLTRRPVGYQLVTIITTEMARRSVMAFTNPANTWLKEDS